MGEQALLQITVLSGPDAGQSQSFRKSRVSLGRDQTNDFVLSDGFVSNRHGEFMFNGSGVKYRDLKSRHGSLVVVNNVSTHIHDPNNGGIVEVDDGTEVQVGCSVIKVSMPEHSRPPQTIQDSFAEMSGSNFGSQSHHREQFITAAYEPVTQLTRRLDSNDRRLEILFQLAKQLNGMTSLERVVEVIVEATFEAFPAANFFAMNMGTTPDEVEEAKPFAAFVRGGGADEEPLLSKSILRRVSEERESILWVKDSLGVDVSQSILDANIQSCLCAPLIGQTGLLGCMQVDTRGRGSLFSKQDLELFNVLTSNVAFAVERARLSDNIVEMFEGFVEASVNAIEARDPTTAGHSQRVAAYTLALATQVNGLGQGRFDGFGLTEEQMTELRYAALLHDFGKIAVREDVLQKAARLSPLNMELIAERFDSIKLQVLATKLQRLSRELGEGKTPTEDFVQIQADSAALTEYLDERLEWLDKASRAGYLPDDEINELKAFGKKTWVDSTGRTRHYLSRFEVENLSIQRGNLNAAEWENMRSHAAQSQDYLQRIPWSPELANIPCIAGQHHEKLDGSGYPMGLLAEDICVQVRMLTIADIFDALTAADRPYRKAATIDRAVGILRDEADENKLDGDLVELFADDVVPGILHLVPSINR